MISRHIVFIVLVLLLLDGTAARAQLPTRDASKPEFSDFELILDKNIFDSKRSSERFAIPENNATTATLLANNPGQELDLRGAWVSQTHRVAFVEGDQAPANGQVEPGSTLAGWRVESIETTGVRLARDKQIIDWPVGKRIARRDDGDWTIVETVASSDFESTAESPGEDGGPQNVTEAASNLIQRMMQRRQRELK